MAMHLIVSNSAEKLAEHFRNEIYLKRTKDEIFVPETVIVQSQGMGVWLTQQLSDPIAANLNTPFLNSFADGILTRFFPDEAKPLMTEDRMFWQLFRILLSDLKDYPELARYVTGKNRNLKACQLAENIAGLFDQYQIYHADLLQEWRDGTGESAGRWQAKLFRQISDGASGRDERFAAFQTRKFTDEETAILPKRISLFGISAMAPVYFEFFRKLGEVAEVWFYYLNPSQEYWSENETRKTAARKRCIKEWDSLKNDPNPDEPMYGNPLLTSLGRQGQDFFRYLSSLAVPPEEQPLFIDYVRPGNNDNWQYQYEEWTMLGVLQEDILQNIYRDPKSDEKEPGNGQPLRDISEPDGSVSIHSCHSELRQVEVLYDQLLALIEKEKYEPRDILVMAPDIGKFEPYIHAVFGGSGSRFQNMYSVTDRNKLSLNRCANTLMKALKLLNGKFTASEVFELFENEEVAERWEIQESDLEEIRIWISKLGVCWGVDAADHERYCGVKFEEFSWKQALDRMILGYAVAEQDVEQAGEPVIPFDSAEGKGCVKLGNFLRFMHELFDFRKKLSGQYPLAKWCDLLEDMLDQLFRSGTRNYKELAALRGTLTILRENAEAAKNEAGTAEQMDLNLAMYLLEKFLIPTGVSEPFLRGKLTFCSLMPMRNIPMPVIAVLGLDEENFPRKDQVLGFNVIPAAKRRTALERSRNHEDRYTFLEALLAARRNLLLLYQGQDPKTNEKRPPAVPLAELEDVLSTTFPECSIKKCRTEHRLQAFDRNYYTGNSTLYSYSEDNFTAAEAFSKRLLSKPDPKPAEFELVWDKESEPETLRRTTPAILEKFFRNPSQFFLETAAALKKKYDDVPIFKDSEDFQLDNLEKYNFHSLVIDHLRAGMSFGESHYQLLKKTNCLPVGVAGRKTYEAECERVRRIPEEWLKSYFAQKNRSVKLEIADVMIEGEIPVSEDGTELYVLNKSSSPAADLISLRLRHLILCAANMPVCSRFWNQQGRGHCQHLDPLSEEQARRELEEWIGFYKDGHHRPLPFFPKSGYKVQPGCLEDEEMINQIQDAFIPKSNSNYGGRGEHDDPAVQRIYAKDALDNGSSVLKNLVEIASVIFRFVNGAEEELNDDAGN